MAETNSAQAALSALNQKVTHASSGRIRCKVITMPATYAQMAIADTIAGGPSNIIPKGSRIVGCRISNGTNTASCTLSVGLRKTDAAKTIVSGTAIAILTAITTATTVPTVASNGTLIAGAVDTVTTEDDEIYCTIAGAVLAANALLRVEVDYIEN
jgi:hypothetical protein